MPEETKPNPIPNVTVKPGIMQPTQVEVTAVGENVHFRVGNSVMTIYYLNAFEIAHWIRMRAAECKAFVGDRGKHVSVLGTLTDLNQK